MKRAWDFDRGRGGFRFEEDKFGFDDVFRFADLDGVRGERDQDSGKRGTAGLTIDLGGVEDGRRLSAAWTTDVVADEDAGVTLLFRYRMTQSGQQQRDEFSDLRVAVDGETIKIGGRSYVERMVGDGPGGGSVTTGWQIAKINLGTLEKGRHEISIGAYANKTDSDKATTRLIVDDVKVQSDEGPVRLAKMERDVLRFTNEFRKQNGLDPLKIDRNLTEAAEDWSREMAKGDFYRHSKVKDQIAEFGYEARGHGENIAGGYETARKVVNAWIDSPGHRANLLREDFEHIGIGYYFQKNDGGAAPFRHYWTQTFGTPQDDYLG